MALEIFTLRRYLSKKYFDSYSTNLILKIDETINAQKTATENLPNLREANQPTTPANLQQHLDHQNQQTQQPQDEKHLQQHQLQHQPVDGLSGVMDSSALIIGKGTNKS